MPEPLLPATVRLTSAAEALAALAAHVRIVSEGLDVDPRIAALVADVATEILGSSAIAPEDPAAQSVGMAKALLRESVDLVTNPGRTGNWATVDEEVLQGVGRLSMSVAPVFAQVAARLPGLGAALAEPSSRFLDVGTGTGWLAIATARTFPRACIEGIDIHEPALALARRNIDAESMGARVSVRHQDVTMIDGPGSFDAVWLPLPFLPQAIVPAAIAGSFRALRPGGWLLAGTFAGGADSLSRTLIDLRIVRSGGHPWTAEEVVSMMGAAAFESASEVERTWPSPLRLFAAQRPA